MWTQQGRDSNGRVPVPFVNALGNCLNKVVTDGYRECFKVTTRGLYSTTRSRYYRPEQVQVVNLFRFEGQANACDNAIVYVIETSDGLKGTLIDTFSTYSDQGITEFISEVEEIGKKMSRHNNRNFC